MHRILELTPVLPVLTVQRLADAVPLATALYRGGLPVIEVTLRTSVALAVISAIRAALPQVVVGAGTLTRVEDFIAARNAGAQFGVTPGLTRRLAAAALVSGYPLLPSIMTPTELLEARAAGYTTCKFFPAQCAGGVEMLRALAGPFPDVTFCPTGGIHARSAARYLELANVSCVGGSWVAPEALIAQGDWNAIEQLAAEAAALRPAA